MTTIQHIVSSESEQTLMHFMYGCLFSRKN